MQSAPMQSAPMQPVRQGFTLVETVIVLAIVSLLAAIVVPRFPALLDQLATRGAASDAIATFSAARNIAVARGSATTTDIDTVARTLTVHIGADTLRHRPLGASYAVKLRSTRPSIVYGPTGMGYGAANLTLVIAKHQAADTVTISRLGRIR